MASVNYLHGLCGTEGNKRWVPPTDKQNKCPTSSLSETFKFIARWTADTNTLRATNHTPEAKDNKIDFNTARFRKRYEIMKYVQAHKQHMSELCLNSFIRACNLMQFFVSKLFSNADLRARLRQNILWQLNGERKSSKAINASLKLRSLPTTALRSCLSSQKNFCDAEKMPTLTHKIHLFFKPRRAANYESVKIHL